MSKWKDLICCSKSKQNEKPEPKHHRGDTKLSLEQVMKDDIIQKYLNNAREKRIVHYVRPRTSLTQETNQPNGINR